MPSAGAALVASTCSPPLALDSICWGLGGGGSGSIASSSPGAEVVDMGFGLSNPKADEVLTKRHQMYHRTS
jgi:hypothetical protein